jgi:hypothetical protein
MNITTPTTTTTTTTHHGYVAQHMIDVDTVHSTSTAGLTIAITAHVHTHRHTRRQAHEAARAREHSSRNALYSTSSDASSPGALCVFGPMIVKEWPDMAG